MTLGQASFRELEIKAKLSALMVDKLAEFGACAEGLFAVVELLFLAVQHVLMGPVKAYCAYGVLLVGCVGTKGIRGRLPCALVRMRVRRL